MIRRALIAGLLLALPQLAQAQSVVTFTIQTQNVLRFGHGSRLLTQCVSIANFAPQVDIIVMQEVMTPGYPCLIGNNNKGVNGNYPPNFAYRTSGWKGRSSYIEYYGILHRTAGGANSVAFLGQDDNLGSQVTYMRPPYGALFRVTGANNQSCDVWIVDFHAVFGKTIGLRRNEAAAMENIYQHLRGLNNGAVLILGDWNLEANDTGFDWVRNIANQAMIDPNVRTSLTRAGALSSEYDHAVTQAAPTLAIGPAIPPLLPTSWIYPSAANWVTWRNQTSDHLGVRLSVTVTC